MAAAATDAAAGAGSEPLEELSLIGRGLTSCTQVTELRQFAPSLTSVCLHGNNITGVESLSQLTRLQHLNLSSNAVASLNGLRGLPSLTSLNLSSNRLAGALPPLHSLPSLTHLNLSYNGLTSLQGLHALLPTDSSTHPPGNLQQHHHPLRKLGVKHNLIGSAHAFGALVHFPALQELSVGGNPVCLQPHHRQQLLSLLPQLAHLDNTPSHNITAATATTASPTLLPPPPPVLPLQPASLHPSTTSHTSHPHATSPHSPPPTLQAPILQAPPPPPPPPPPHTQPLTPPPPAHTQQQPQAHFVLPPPALSAHAPPQQQLQQQQQQQQRVQLEQQHLQHAWPPSSGHYSTDAHTLTGAQQPQALPYTTTTVGAQGWRGEVPDLPSAGAAGGPARLVRGPEAQPSNRVRRAQGQVLNQGSPQGPGQQPTRQQLQQQPAAARRVVYLVDAAVQASSDAKTVARTQKEVEQLRAQLAEMAEELAQRVRGDQKAQQQMDSILQASEDDARQRIEQGYREASEAVSKALREVDWARKAASEAEGRAHNSEKEKCAAQAQVEALQQQLRRAQQDASQAVESKDAEAARSIAALKEDLRRASGSEAALREELRRAAAAEAALKAGLHDAQLQACNAAKAEVKSAASLEAAEQRIAALEASLQQSSSTAISLTTQVAKGMADADAQVSALKAQLASSEQAVQAASSREHELLGRVKGLAEASAAAAQQHTKELEQLRQQAAQDVAAAREAEGRAAEERGRLSMAAQAEHERSVLQEQLTYLKVQLQYALEESDKERAGFQDRLTASEQQVATLTAAVQEAAQKGRVFEELVTDLSNVVSQQKQHIQAIQKEREALAVQLRASGPEQLQRLTAQLAAARGAAADAVVMREQAETSRQRWQDAERRIVEQQVEAMARVEELSHRCSRLEKACAASKEEAQRSAARASDLASQLSSAEDALKIKVAMLDSAHETISALKAELEDYATEAEEARRAAEEAEAHAAQQAEADNQEKANLRSELVAGESALESMSQNMASAQAKQKEAEDRLKEAENRLKAVEEQLREKSELIKYVEEEVERVKGLFEKREAKIREERDAAQAAAERAQKACSSAEVHLAEVTARADTLTAELNKERHAAAAALEASARTQAEADQLSSRLQEVEGEMRALLEAVERQKLASVTKMRQLASFLTDLG